MEDRQTTRRGHNRRLAINAPAASITAAKTFRTSARACPPRPQRPRRRRRSTRFARGNRDWHALRASTTRTALRRPDGDIVVPRSAYRMASARRASGRPSVTSNGRWPSRNRPASWRSEQAHLRRIAEAGEDQEHRRRRRTRSVVRVDKHGQRGAGNVGQLEQQLVREITRPRIRSGHVAVEAVHCSCRDAAAQPIANAIATMLTPPIVESPKADITPGPTTSARGSHRSRTCDSTSTRPSCRRTFPRRQPTAQR